MAAIQKGDTFTDYFADSRGTFTIEATGTMDDGTKVFKGVCDDADYGLIEKIVTEGFINKQRERVYF